MWRINPSDLALRAASSAVPGEEVLQNIPPQSVEEQRVDVGRSESFQAGVEFLAPDFRIRCFFAVHGDFSRDKHYATVIGFYGSPQGHFALPATINKSGIEVGNSQVDAALDQRYRFFHIYFLLFGHGQAHHTKTQDRGLKTSFTQLFVLHLKSSLLLSFDRTPSARC